MKRISLLFITIALAFSFSSYAVTQSIHIQSQVVSQHIKISVYRASKEALSTSAEFQATVMPRVQLNITHSTRLLRILELSTDTQVERQPMLESSQAFMQSTSLPMSEEFDWQYGDFGSTSSSNESHDLFNSSLITPKTYSF